MRVCQFAACHLHDRLIALRCRPARAATYNNNVGAECWARVISQNYVRGESVARIVRACQWE